MAMARPLASRGPSIGASRRALFIEAHGIDAQIAAAVDAAIAEDSAHPLIFISQYLLQPGGARVRHFGDEQQLQERQRLELRCLELERQNRQSIELANRNREIADEQAQRCREADATASALQDRVKSLSLTNKALLLQQEALKSELQSLRHALPMLRVPLSTAVPSPPDIPLPPPAPPPATEPPATAPSDPKQQPPVERYVLLKRSRSERFGLEIEFADGVAMIAALAEGTAGGRAAAEGLLQSGEHVLSINGQSIGTEDDVAALVQEQPDTLSLVVVSHVSAEATALDDDLGAGVGLAAREPDV